MMLSHGLGSFVQGTGSILTILNSAKHSRLIKHTVESIRTKLDRIYLEALDNSSSVAHDQSTNDQEVTDLQAELESLYSEILPVAQMSAEQQFLEPALYTIAACEGQGQERTAKAVQYV